VSLLRSTAEPQADGTTVRLTLEGEFDGYSAEDFAAWANDAGASGATRLEIDLGDVTFIDSGGLAALVSVTRTFRRFDGDVVVRRPTPNAMRVFEITGLNRVLTIDS
jgi:anti-anti-sigma factor